MKTNDLSNIKGIGPSKIEKLGQAKIYTINQLANSTPQYLAKIDGIGVKSANKWISAAKNFLKNNVTTPENAIKDSIVKEKIQSTVIESSYTEISSIQSDVKKIYNKLDNLDYRLKTIENKVYESKNRELIIPKITEAHFLRTLRVAYDSLEKRIENFVSVSALTEKLKEFIPWSTEKIHSEIYKLFMNYQVDLQPGKKFDGEPLVQDGKSFVWFKFKS